ncbi:MAG: diguanylate cyclase [Alphaproteobacteria bacterium]|nr:diguanylate cyclase [Alphaproteobacteria bacterium]
MLQHFNNLKYIFSTIRSSFVPAFFLLAALLYFYAQNPFPFEMSLVFHSLFLAFSALTVILLYLANRSKPLFTVLLGMLCYFLINRLKTQYGQEFISSNEYRTMCFVLPLNLLVLYFLPTAKLKSAFAKYTLVALLTEVVILQHTCRYIAALPYMNITLEAVPLWAYAPWAAVLTIMAVDISVKNSIINTGLFFIAGSLFMGMIYANTASGLTVFFLSFIIIAAVTIVIDLYNRYHYDYLENVGSKNAYLVHANSKFPFKYTIVLFSIDNGDKLQKAIGHRKYKALEQMLVNRILELPYELTLYRYNDNELIMVFKNEDAKHVKEFADNIRHTIAASEFVFTDRKNVKITISVCVSEKTRKDLNAAEVTERAHNALNKSHHFNCNITTVA